MGTGTYIRNEPSIVEADLRYHLHAMTKPAHRTEDDVNVIESAKGCYVTIKGRRYFDGLSGLGCVNIGYSNPDVAEAGYKALLNMSYANSFGGLANRDAATLAAKLVELTHGDFEKFFFASTGSDANESAVKIAYYYWLLRGQPQKRLLLSRKHAYHGNTIVATSLTGIDHYHPQFGLPLPGLVHHVDAPYHYRYGAGRPAEEFGLEAARSLERKIIEIGAENIAAFFGEPVQGTGGIIVPPEGYWGEIRRICDKYDILLVADEVITGFGKTGSMFGYQHFGFKPDLLTMAKGLTSGYFPMSAVGLSPKVYEVLADTDHEFEHGFTYCAHPVGAAIALANIAVIEDGLVERTRTGIAPKIAAALERLSAKAIVGEVRSLGVMAAVEFVAPSGSPEDCLALGARVVREAFARGLIGREVGASFVLILPLITTDQELDRMFAIIDESIDAAQAGGDFVAPASWPDWA